MSDCLLLCDRVHAGDG